MTWPLFAGTGADLERGLVVHLPSGEATCRLLWVDLVAAPRRRPPRFAARSSPPPLPTRSAACGRSTRTRGPTTSPPSPPHGWQPSSTSTDTTEREDQHVQQEHHRQAHDHRDDPGASWSSGRATTAPTARAGSPPTSADTTSSTAPRSVRCSATARGCTPGPPPPYCGPPGCDTWKGYSPRVLPQRGF